MANKAMYEVVNTKVSAMAGKLLKKEDYKRMIELKSPIEIAVYLKENTSYGELFSELRPENMRRADIERVLNECLIDSISSLINYFNGDYRNFFKCFYIKYEIYDLKAIARLIHIDQDFAHVKDKLIFRENYRYMDMERIGRAKSIKELIEALEGTVYYPFVKNLIDGNSEESLYRFEMALDKSYFSILEDNVKKLDDKDIKAFYKLYGSYIDMLNIQWIYRGKKYYNLTAAEIFNYCINKGLKFNVKSIKELCYTRNINELAGKVQNTPYSFMLKGDRLQDIFMERRMNRYMYFKLRSAQKGFYRDISSPLAYLELLEFEIKDIISMIENVRYGMEYDEARKYLIKAL